MFNTGVRTRPLGITIIAFLMGLSALLGICGALTSLGFAPFEVFTRAGLGGFFSTSVGGIISLVLSIASLVLALGLWTLQPWAFWLTVLVEVLHIFNAGVFSGGRVGLGCGTGLIPFIVLLYLFLDGNVRRAFRT